MFVVPSDNLFNYFLITWKDIFFFAFFTGRLVREASTAKSAFSELFTLTLLRTLSNPRLPPQTIYGRGMDKVRAHPPPNNDLRPAHQRRRYSSNL